MTPQTPYPHIPCNALIFSFSSLHLDCDYFDFCTDDFIHANDRKPLVFLNKFDIVLAKLYDLATLQRGLDHIRRNASLLRPQISMPFDYKFVLAYINHILRYLGLFKSFSFQVGE